MLNSPEVEFDIRARQRFLANRLASEANLPIDFTALLEKIQAQSDSLAPPTDILTFFALQRLGQEVKMPVVKFEQPGQKVSPASLVWVASNIEANPADAAELAKAVLVVAPDDWSPLISQAKVKPRRPGM